MSRFPYAGCIEAPPDFRNKLVFVSKLKLDARAQTCSPKDMVHVIATIEVAPGKRDAFLAEFRKLMPKVHAERGCIEYGPVIDVDSGIPAQDPLRPNIVVVIEKWSDLDALKAHLVAPHMDDYREKVKEMLRGLKLQVLQPAG
jgi:quinol monooxygenase YgiN